MHHVTSCVRNDIKTECNVVQPDMLMTCIVVIFRHRCLVGLLDVTGSKYIASWLAVDVINACCVNHCRLHGSIRDGPTTIFERLRPSTVINN